MNLGMISMTDNVIFIIHQFCDVPYIEQLHHVHLQGNAI